MDELWRRGILAPWKLHEGQKKMYQAIEESDAKKFVINSSRRLGKSWMLCVIALEQGYKVPHSQIKFAAPNQKMARKIVFPLFKQILENCPKHLRPKFKLHDGVYEFANGSEIHIAGSEMNQIDSLRGQACDLALLDEAGFMTDLEYVIESVLVPQTLTRKDARLILASTPPVSPDHPFVSRYIKNAMAQEAYAKFTIYDNPMLTPEQIELYMEEAGGADSTTWRREYLADIVTEKTNALFPEATDEAMEDIVLEIQRPDQFIPLTVIDLGYVDYTGILFGYYHFPAGKVVIEDELLMNRTTSAEIVQQVYDKEKELWGDRKPFTRVVDAQALAIADLNSMYRFNCRAPAKSDLEANVNRVRMDVGQQNMIISPKCTNLIAQLKYATGDNNRRSFSRNSSGGHWDLAAAMVYFAKHIDRRTNPFPPGYGYDPHTTWGIPTKHPDTAMEKMRQMFPFQAAFKNRF